MRVAELIVLRTADNAVARLDDREEAARARRVRAVVAGDIDRGLRRDAGGFPLLGVQPVDDIHLLLIFAVAGEQDRYIAVGDLDEDRAVVEEVLVLVFPAADGSEDFDRDLFVGPLRVENEALAGLRCDDLRAGTPDGPEDDAVERRVLSETVLVDDLQHNVFDAEVRLREFRETADVVGVRMAQDHIVEPSRPEALQFFLDDAVIPLLPGVHEHREVRVLAVDERRGPLPHIEETHGEGLVVDLPFFDLLRHTEELIDVVPVREVFIDFLPEGKQCREAQNDKSQKTGKGFSKHKNHQ